MFARIMAVVLAAILVLTIGFSAMAAFVMRQERTNTRLSDLTGQAREIAWLAGHNRGSGQIYLYGTGSSSTMDYINWKAEKIYREYGGALVVVVDRMGRVLHNVSKAFEDNPDFVNSLNSEELGDELSRVLAGEEVVLRAVTNGSLTFTVGVPFTQNGKVFGAVLIRTPAQIIEGGLWDFLPRQGLLSLAALLLAGVALFLYIRRVMRPLRRLTDAAEAMKDGDFSIQLPTEGESPEIRALSSSFNAMKEKLSVTETQRREFVANVSHELRSPVTSIAGYVQGMEDGTIPPGDHPRYLAVVGSECRRLSKLIEDLLALSRLERDDTTLNCTRFDLCELFRRAIIRCMGKFEEKHLEVECDFHEDPCWVMADTDRMEQVMTNLLDNAIKFTPEGGKVTLGVERRGELAQASVTDTGIGIRPEDLPRVFERFFTENRAHTANKGTGLGLAICQRILEMHGQSIWVERSVEGEGTSIAFTLPLAQGGEEA